MSFPKPVDLSTGSRPRKRSLDEGTPLPPPAAPKTSTLAGLSSRSGTGSSTYFTGSSGSSGSTLFSPKKSPFDKGYTLSSGQPVLDLHSALNNIHKSFTIGDRSSRSTSSPRGPPFSMGSSLGSLRLSNGGMSPSPPPCPPPNLPLWTSLAMANSFNSALGTPRGPLLNYPPPPAHQSIPLPSNCGPGVSPPPTPFKAAPPLAFTAPPTPPGLATLASSMTGNGGASSGSGSVKSEPGRSISPTGNQMSKYNQLLLVLDEMNKDVRPSYAGSKSSVERLRRGIAHARLLVHEALIETERNSRN